MKKNSKIQKQKSAIQQFNKSNLRHIELEERHFPLDSVTEGTELLDSKTTEVCHEIQSPSETDKSKQEALDDVLDEETSGGCDENESKESEVHHGKVSEDATEHQQEEG